MKNQIPFPSQTIRDTKKHYDKELFTRKKCSN